MHSHHSHSGDYISHANGSLESMVEQAIAKKFTHYCLTEHMPRLFNKYLYPEELEKAYTSSNLHSDFQNYLQHARNLQEKQTNVDKKIQLLVGFEVEGIDSVHIQEAKNILPLVDMCVGSVHYVHGIPIDFNRELWVQARNTCAEKTTRNLYKDYFDLQYEVLTELRPQVVGHFDLIRLFDTEKDEIDITTGKSLGDINLASDWPDVWSAVVKNIEFVVSYNGLFELNSASLRKGWISSYPQIDIALAIKELGGKFCLSDDAHTTAQVGLNYERMWKYIVEDLCLSHIYHLELENSRTVIVEDSVEELSRSSFWKQ